MLQEICLALAIYHEARGEPLAGKHAVAEVVVNRAENRKKDFCDVVFERNQFSWTRGNWKQHHKDAKAWDASVKVASMHLNGSPTNYTKGSEYFCSSRMNMARAWGVRKMVTIGSHTFYKR